MGNSFEEYLDSLIEEFQSVISSFCREGFVYDKQYNSTHSSGFHILDVADPLFFKGKYQGDYLECEIRDILINKSFDYLFRNYGYDIRWRGPSLGGLTNAVFESKFPIEFFVVENGNYIAFRYSPFQADYSIPQNLPRDLLLSYYKTGVKTIAKWICIDWNSESKKELDEKKKCDKGYTIHEPFQTYISVEELFERYFTLGDYSTFMNKVKKAVGVANKTIGFQTISRLIPDNVLLFKDTVAQELLEYDFNSKDYIMVDHKGNHISSVQSSSVSNGIVRRNFFDESRYWALVGDKKFAKSFFTAEYMYKYFKEGLSLDYTSVVAGYIKCVEQLCENYYREILLKDNEDEIYVLADNALFSASNKAIMNEIKSNGKLKYWNNKKYILVSPESEQWYHKHPTLGQMKNVFDCNRQVLFEPSLRESLDSLFSCWDNFISFDRNGYFHKDNIDDFKVVERIRNNAFLLIYWLLGGITPRNNENELLKVLGVGNNEFDRVFRKIAYRRQYRYRITEEGREFYAIRIPKRMEYSFDENGHIVDGKLMFVEVDEYPSDFIKYYEYIKKIGSDSIIIYTKDNLPDSMVLINYDGDEETVI